MLQKKTICFFNTNLAWGGGEKWHLETAKLMRDQGYNVVVFAHPNSDLLQKAKQLNIKTEAQSITNLSFINLFTLINLLSKFKKYKVDTVITNLASDMKAGCIAAAWAKIPNIIYRRGNARIIKNSWINRYIFQNILTSLIVNSKDLKEKILSYNSRIVKANKIHVVQNYIPSSKDESSFPLTRPENKKLILSNAGRLVEQKGQKYLLQLAQRLKEQSYSFEMHIAGKGPLESELKALASEAKVDDVIVWHGFVENMRSFIEKTDVFLFPSVHEGMSNVILEVMNVGRPIVAFNVSSMAEIINHESTGYLIPFDDLDAFEQYTIKLMNDSQLRQKMALKAKQRIFEVFNERTFLERFSNLI